MGRCRFKLIPDHVSEVRKVDGSEPPNCDSADRHAAVG